MEEDLQQVNLTRFNLFFPEKREFFLEGQGIFAFGGAPLQASGGINRDIPILFFSRQVGLSQGQSVPVVAGGRITGRAGAYTVGAINIQTGEKASAGAPATNFSIVRLKRDILRRSTIGLIATRRDPSGMSDSNVAGGLDASFGFFDSLNASGYYARTTPGPCGHRLQCELSDASFEYGRGSLRRRGRAPGDRRGLQPGSRVHPAQRLPPDPRSGAVQPSHTPEQTGPQAVVAGKPRLCRG